MSPESQGALPLEQFSYDQASCGKLPTEAQVQAAWEYRIARWMRVNVQSVAEMKAQLARGFPVIAGMNFYQSLVDWTGGGVYKREIAEAGHNVGGHALLVVGFADQLKAFKVLNSWGKSWGDGGYAWIDYATFQRMTEEGYVTIDIFLQQHLASASPTPVASAPLPVGGSTPPTPRPPEIATRNPRLRRHRMAWCAQCHARQHRHPQRRHSPSRRNC